ncbi:hypothetical protein [uncultured Deinococcus sp.]|uniref:hypothetical protein n=1 Tax=uncultured Deinococcus sp. TaxID=158789 RepID=UPI00258C070F|nr:hypothetical protein [uncultured Deinococcus sp.]
MAGGVAPTPSALALALARAYARLCRGWGPDAEWEWLADYLGCHEEMRDAAWDCWRTELELTGGDVGLAGGFCYYGVEDACPVE